MKMMHMDVVETAKTERPVAIHKMSNSMHMTISGKYLSLMLLRSNLTKGSACKATKWCPVTKHIIIQLSFRRAKKAPYGSQLQCPNHQADGFPHTKNTWIVVKKSHYVLRAESETSSYIFQNVLQETEIHVRNPTPHFHVLTSQTMSAKDIDSVAVPSVLHFNNN